MKFPLKNRPFSHVELSAQQSSEYETLIDEITAATLQEFDTYVLTAQRTMNKRHWKPVKRQEDVTVYKQAKRRHPQTGPTASSHPVENQQWRMPKLLAVGTIPGTLNDVMYGIVATDPQSPSATTSYLHRESLDSAVLHRIGSAMRDKPFRSLNLVWSVKGHTSTVGKMIRPRDFVFLEGTGIKTLPDGTCVGYHVAHSVDLPECGKLTSLSIRRARMSSCHLYREQHPGVVEVYMVMYADLGGNFPERFAIASAVSTLLESCKVMWRAKTKKLAWLFTDNDAHRRFREAGPTNVVEVSQRRCCCVCNKKLRAYNSILGCQLCYAWICSRCTVTRRLPPTCKQSSGQCNIDVCKTCVTRVAGLDAFEIAQNQFVCETDKETVELEEDEGLISRPNAISEPPQLGGEDQNEWSHVDHVDELITPDGSADDWESETPRSSHDEWELETLTIASPEARSVVSSHHDGSHASLMEQMVSLCIAAEHAYQITTMYSNQLQAEPLHADRSSEVASHPLFV